MGLLSDAQGPASHGGARRGGGRGARRAASTRPHLLRDALWATAWRRKKCLARAVGHGLSGRRPCGGAGQRHAVRPGGRHLDATARASSAWPSACTAARCSSTTTARRRVELPFGGVKSSGYGREKGFEALYGFTTLKTVAIKARQSRPFPCLLLFARSFSHAPVSPAPRKASHIRRVTYQGYEREDGCGTWKPKCTTARRTLRLRFTRAFGWGDPIHHMWLRVTIDRQLVVHAIEAAMDAHPLQDCHRRARLCRAWWAPAWRAAGARPLRSTWAGWPVAPTCASAVQHGHRCLPDLARRLWWRRPDTPPATWANARVGTLRATGERVLSAVLRAWRGQYAAFHPTQPEQAKELSAYPSSASSYQNRANTKETAMRVQNKSIIVTGAGNGIGEGIAKRLARRCPGAGQ